MRRWWIAIVLLVGLAAGALLASRGGSPGEAAIGALSLRGAPEAEDVVLQGAGDTADPGPARPPPAFCDLSSLGADMPTSGQLIAKLAERVVDVPVRVREGRFQVPAAVAAAPEATMMLEARGYRGLMLRWERGSGCQLEMIVREDPSFTETRCPVDIQGPAPEQVSLRVDGYDPAERQFVWRGPGEPLKNEPTEIPPIIRAELEGRTLVITGPAEGSGTLDLRGADGGEDLPPLPVSWSPEGCSPVRIGYWATIRGSIAGVGPGEDARVEGCGADAAAPGGRFEIRVEAAACELMAWRYDGRLRAYGPAVPVDPRPGRDMTVELAVPDEPVGGIGFSLEEHESGIAVMEVHPGTPAAEIGLQPGDVITAVDGEPTADLSSSGFIVLGTGPVGSAVELEVLRGEERFTVEAIRARLE